jgi:hypothetical protein
MHEPRKTKNKAVNPENDFVMVGGWPIRRDVFERLRSRGSPPKERGGCYTAPNSNGDAAYHSHAIAQIWTNEARRLAGEFSVTGDWRHFRALIRHLAGMCLRLVRPVAVSRFRGEGRTPEQT